MPYPTVGSIAPLFSLPDQRGTMRSLEDERGKWVLVYFYPKDDTPGCTKEACAIRDEHPHFERLNAVVFGISADTVKSHGKFAEKFTLPFALLADEKKEAIHAYGVWQKKRFMGREYLGIARTSFLIDPEGRIAHVYVDVKPADHAEEVLADITRLQKMK